MGGGNSAENSNLKSQSADRTSSTSNNSAFSRKRKRLVVDSDDDEDGQSFTYTDSSKAENVDPAQGHDAKKVTEFSSPSWMSLIATSSSRKKRAFGVSEVTDHGCHSLSVKSCADGVLSPWEHLSLSFLRSDSVMDSCKRRPYHPDYDAQTLYVPSEFLSKQTPAMKQWWQLKARYADVILFFKMGKFYEMYHMDAVIGVEHLSLIYMKGSYAHCGFPEIAFSRNADILVKKGYKVGRVEQTESVESMNERTKGNKGSEKVVRREVCQLLTPGTCTSDLRSELSRNTVHTISDVDECNVLSDLPDPESVLIAVAELDLHGAGIDRVFGVAILNASNGRIKMGQFPDDRYCSRLRSLLSRNSASQVLVQRGSISGALKTLLSTCLSGVPVEYLCRGKQFWSANDTIVELESAAYFSSSKCSSTSITPHPLFVGKEDWPHALLSSLKEDDPLGRTVKADSDLAVSCLGAVIFYLRYCLIDREILSLGAIDKYNPPDYFSSSFDWNVQPNDSFYFQQTSLIIDSVTLTNLDILQNSHTGTREGTLIELLDTCCTPFGRRLLRQWLTAPLCNPDAIRIRQDSVEDLILFNSQMFQIKEYLRRLPDFDRLLTKIHLVGSKGKDKNHPDNRAILYDEMHYSQRNICDFVATLNGYELVYEMLTHMDSISFNSPHLSNLTQTVDFGGHLPCLSSKISYFKNAFDTEKAKRDGRIIPEPGIDEDYDLAVKDIEAINNELESYLISCSRRLGVKLTYWGTGRNRFQLEVPDSITSRVPSDWQLASQRKGVKRYRGAETQDLLMRLMAAEERKDMCLRQIAHSLFTSFSESFTQFYTAMRCVAELDCLIALATYSTNASDIMCRPEFVDLCSGSQQPFLEILDGRHPCLINIFSGGDFIPNDVCLGSFDSVSTPHTLLVTGPNMGGKSTLMRQTALLVILAHLGCRVPARSCRLTPVDRIFSRLGATDRLLAGESTFMVELSETAAILRHISPHSLILMDELGRGTSTHDGASLASAVLHFLVKPASQFSTISGPRTLFSTHYHSLVDEVGARRNSIGLGHMACMVEEQTEAQPGLENITFLYKFIEGACPKSYGFNAARLAHLPDEVIQAGLAKAKEFERTITTFSCLRHLLSSSTDFLSAQNWLIKLQNL